MADVKVSGLPAASAFNLTDELEANQAGTSRRVTGTQIKAGLGAGLVLVGSDLTERTTTATGADAANLSSVSSISIPQGTPFRIMFRFRKTAGAAAFAKLGIKINATQVYSSNAANSIQLSNTNQAESGIAFIDFLPGATNYGAMVRGYWHRDNGADSVGAKNENIPGGNDQLTNPMPSATVTSITITGDAVNASQTLATDQLRVWTYPIS